MSYEGYIKALCAKGHLSQWDAYVERDAACDCGEKFVWECHVDQTNGDIDPETGLEPGDVELEIEFPAMTEKCSCCGHTKVVEEVRYKIPTNVGHTEVCGYGVNLSNPNDAVVARKLSELGITQDQHCCFFDAGKTVVSLHLGAPCWAPGKVPAQPAWLDEGRLPGETYKFGGGTFKVKLEDLLRCTSIDQVVDLTVGQEDAIHWQILQA
jgi:hypothetical protein